MKRFRKEPFGVEESTIELVDGYYIIKVKALPKDLQKLSMTKKTITVFTTGGHIWKDSIEPESENQTLGFNLTVSLTLPNTKPQEATK